MRILVTGDRGTVGVPVAGFLRRTGYEVAGFDRAGGADVLDLPALRRAARGCAAIVHPAALAHDSAGSPEQIMAVNVLGTWHVLLAAEASGRTWRRSATPASLTPSSTGSRPSTTRSRLHAAMDYVTRTTSTKAEARRSARPAATGSPKRG